MLSHKTNTAHGYSTYVIQVLQNFPPIPTYFCMDFWQNISVTKQKMDFKDISIGCCHGRDVIQANQAGDR